jgi:hypothetical protein
MPFHAAHLESSARLQELLKFFESVGGRGCTGADIWAATRMLNPGTYVSELNWNFHRLKQPREIVGQWERDSVNGRRRFRYFLKPCLVKTSNTTTAAQTA